VRDLHEAEHGIDAEEHQHDRPEERRYACRATALREEQRDQDDERRRQYERVRPSLTCFMPSSADSTEIAG